MSLLTFCFFENSNKQDLLIEVVDLTSNVITMTLNAAKTSFNEIQVLELDHEVISESLNEMQTDMSDLQQKHSQFAEEYITL